MMIGMEMDGFLKTRQPERFSNIQVRLEILQKYSCNTKFLKELFSIIYLEFIKFVFDEFSEHFLHM